jgi:hypothetical protein
MGECTRSAAVRDWTVDELAAEQDLAGADRGQDRRHPGVAANPAPSPKDDGRSR